jgi:hypothetical protein
LLWETIFHSIVSFSSSSKLDDINGDVLCTPIN